MEKLILISGKAEHGKTTTAEMLKNELEKLGKKVIITRYAYYLKDIAKRYCGWNGNKDAAGRELLQRLGTEIIRQKMNKPLFHVGRICEDIEIGQDYVNYVIVDDVRYPNEIYYPKAIFGNKVLTIRVNRFSPLNNNIPFESSLSNEQKKHISEISLDNFKFDYQINTSSLDDNMNAIKSIMDLEIKKED